MSVAKRAAQAKSRHDGDADYYAGPDDRDGDIDADDLRWKLFGDKLRVARALADLSMAQVGLSANISANAVAKYEAGEMTPKSSTLVDLARLYGVSLDWLMCSCPITLGWHAGACGEGVERRAKMIVKTCGEGRTE